MPRFTEEDDALLDELGVEVETNKESSRTPREERVIAGFEEISVSSSSMAVPRGMGRTATSSHGLPARRRRERRCSWRFRSPSPCGRSGCGFSVCLRSRFKVVCAQIACAHRKHLIAPIGVDRAPVNRVDANPVALAGEFERCRLGEQSDPALGHRIERIVRRADKAGHGNQVDNGAAVRAVLAALAQRGH